MRFPVGNLTWVNDGYKKTKQKKKVHNFFFRGKKKKNLHKEENVIATYTWHGLVKNSSSRIAITTEY